MCSPIGPGGWWQIHQIGKILRLFRSDPWVISAIGRAVDGWRRIAPAVAIVLNLHDNPATVSLHEGEEPSYPPEYDQLKKGVPRDEALRLFRSACNHRCTLFVTDKWFEKHRVYLRWGLHRRITSDEAEGLRTALRQEVSLAYLCVWLCRPFRSAWGKHLGRLQARRARLQAEAEAVPRTPGAAIFPWAHVEACRERAEGAVSGKPSPTDLFPDLPSSDKDHYLLNALPCPCCKSSASELSWIYFVSPKTTWEWMCGRAGWLTVCEKCRIQVQFFLEMMN